MTKLDAAKQAADQLDLEELKDLYGWVCDRLTAEADRRLEEAVERGAFDELAAEALREHEAGNTTPL